MKNRLLIVFLSVWLAAATWVYLRQRTALSHAQQALAVATEAADTDDQQPFTGVAPEPPPSRELLRLRGQVGVLRRELAQVDPGEAARRAYSNDWATVYSGPRPSQQPGFVAFTNVVKTGFATPEAALQSFHHALLNQAKGPLSQTEMKEMWDVPEDFDQPPGYNLHMGEGFYGGAGYRIVSQEMLGPHLVRLTIDYEKEDGSSYRRERLFVEHKGSWRLKPAGLTRANAEP